MERELGENVSFLAGATLYLPRESARKELLPLRECCRLHFPPLAGVISFASEWNKTSPAVVDELEQVPIESIEMLGSDSTV